MSEIKMLMVITEQCGRQFIGECSVDEESLSIWGSDDGYITVSEPVVLVTISASTPQGPSRSTTLMPVYDIGWISWIKVRPSSYTKCCAEMEEVYRNALTELRRRHDTDRARRSGLHVASKIPPSDVAAANALQKLKVH